MSILSPSKVSVFTLLVLVLPQLCRADSFTYQFTAIDTPVFGSFVSYGWSFSTPNILQATTTVTDFLSTSASSGCTINSVIITNPGTQFDINTFFGGFGGGGGCPGSAQDIVSNLFNSTGIAAPGTYLVTIESATGTLNISGTAATLEPSSLFLVGVGLLAVFSFLTRRTPSVPHAETVGQSNGTESKPAIEAAEAESEPKDLAQRKGRH